MSEGWVKLHRRFTDWEWFNISEMVHLFIYLMLNANHDDNEWRGIFIKRGQILTGLNSLHQKTKISNQTLRTCLKRLEKTGEINIQSTNKYSIITICNYDSYQLEQQTTNKQTNKQLTNNQQTTNKQLTTNKNDNNDNNEKNVIRKNDFDFSFVELDYKKPFDEWMQYKKDRKENYKSQNSIVKFYNQLKLYSNFNPETAQQIVDNSMSNNWAGIFKPKTESNGPRNNERINSELNPNAYWDNAKNTN